MDWRKMAAMVSTPNEYSPLKWPITITSVLTTCLAMILFLSFRSEVWFTYELVHIDNRSLNSNSTNTYSRLLEYGHLGLWTICIGNYDRFQPECDTWTEETRPHSFNVIIVLLSCALFLVNLTVFPSWGTSILILYNRNNCYIRAIVGFIWILFLLTVSFTVLLLIALILMTLTKFYSPGFFIIDTNHLFFQSGQGLFYARFATFLALVSLILVIGTLIWKKMIEMRMIEAERSLWKELSDEGFQPGWHRTVIAPRTPDRNSNEPPPYDSYRR